MRWLTVVQVIVPLALLFWLWWRKPLTRLELLAGMTSAIGTLAAFGVGLPWMAVPWYAPYASIAIALGLAARGWIQVPRFPSSAPFGVQRWLGLATNALVSATMLMILLLAAIGMRLPPEAGAVDLACPFPSGVYLVANGGNSVLLNSHLGTLKPDPRHVPWRGQSYGIDLVELNGWGIRADGVAPSDPTRYFIHGRTVTAPCSGRVVSTENDRPDLPVPERDPDRTKLAGNHVMMDCNGVDVLLAHLRRGSVRVAVGDAVTRGQAVGVVGNSGNTSEPHLHVSAQRRRETEPWLGGEPVWITIDGRFLSRNDRLTCRSTP
jgi:hypothetical protein